LLIDQRAIGTNQNKKFVYVIDDKKMVVYREVTLGKQHDRHRVVLSGVVQGDHVVVNGLSHIRPNMMVTAKLESVDAELVN
ncbi:MAG: efflux transporter periplasmic adaptor subunit, partial [Gammaproteobacteria bacterium]